MTGHRELADQALRDIVALEAQVEAGEIDAGRARALRRGYEATAAAALETADPGAATGPDGDPAGPAPGRTRRGPRTWTPVYLLAVVVALVAAVVVLPAAVVDRPSGRAVSGIEPMAGGPGGSGGPPPIDPAAADDAQLETVVADNPTVVGMRLALADRYVSSGQYGKAMRHYMTAAAQRPDDADVRTRLAWLLLQIGQTGPALENADRALVLVPDSVEAAWVRANVLINGTRDVRGGIVALERLAARRDLPSEVRSRVDELLRSARQTAATSTAGPVRTPR